MSYLYENFRNQRDQTTGIHLDFFFSSKGADLQKCPVGMLRSLLNQLFVRSESVRSYIRTYYHDTYANFNVEDKDRLWQQADLERLLQTTILIAAAEQQVTIFVDALDEAGDVFAREIAVYLHGVNDQAISLSRPVKICASSRPYPILARVQALQICVDRCNADAIALFVRDRLDLASLIEHDDPNREEWQSIRSSITNQANGLFQWAYLVVSFIQDKVSDGESTAVIRRWLSEIPPELDTVYSHMLQQILRRGYRTQSLFLFQWVLFAQNPISLSDIRYALAARYAPENYLERYEDLDWFIKSDENMMKRIKTWTGGLIELNESERLRMMDRCINQGRFGLQVTHKSVKDFLLCKGLATLSMTSEAISHSPNPYKLAAVIPEPMHEAYEALYRTCLTYIDHECSLYKTWTYSPLVLKTRSPLILHASASLLHYARYAFQGKVDSIAKEVQTLQKIYNTWILIVKWLDDSNHSANRYVCDTPNPKLFHTACAADLGQIVFHLQSLNDAKDNLDEKGRSAINVAAAYGALNSAKSLSKAGVDLSAMSRDHNTPLSLAAAHGNREFCDWLLEEGVLFNADPMTLQAVLCSAAESGNLHLVQLLIQNGVDIRMLGKNTSGEVASALHFAAARGHEQMVRLLLEKGAEVDCNSLDLGYILASLSLFTEKRQVARRILRLLLDAGADVNPYKENSSMASQAELSSSSNCELLRLGVDGAGVRFDPLTVAADAHDEEMVRVLLRNGADPNLEMPESSIKRLQSNSPNIFRLLVQAGLKEEKSIPDLEFVLAREFIHLRELCWSHTSALERFFGADVDSSILKRACGRALCTVVSSDDLDRAQFLLEKGADVNYCDSHFRNPLFIAVRSNQAEMATFLFERGATLYVRDGNNETLLHHGVLGSASTKLISWLIQQEVPLEAQDSWDRTPLHLAVTNGGLETARILLKHGASPNTRDVYGESPFDYAKSRGHYDLIRVMKNSDHIVEEDSKHIRSRILQHSVVTLATNLLRGDHECRRRAPGLDALGRCLLFLNAHDEARQCFQNTFRYGDSGFKYGTRCSLCEADYMECWHICTLCHKSACQACFLFIKSKESAFGECYDHDFLTMSAPSISDYVPTATDTRFIGESRFCQANRDKSQHFLVDLISRYSRIEL